MGTVVKNPLASAWDSGSIPGSRRSPGVGNGNPLQYLLPEDSIDRIAWQIAVHRFHGQRSLAAYSPWGHKEVDMTECAHTKRQCSDKKKKEKSACQFRGHSRYGLDPWVRKTPTNRKWQPIPVFFPGKFHGQRSLVGYKESDTTRTHTYLCKKQSFLPKWIKITFSNWLF